MKQLPANKVKDEEYKNQNPNIADWKASSKFDAPKSVLYKYNWRVLDPKIMIRAIALAGETLITVGPADTLDEVSLYGKFNAPENQPRLLEQEEVFNGNSGGHMWLMDNS